MPTTFGGEPFKQYYQL
ncbi:hypothetical protein [Staphylococcus aureus]